MQWSTKAGLLLRRCKAKQRRSEAELAKIAHKTTVLDSEEKALMEQSEGVRKLMLAQRPSGVLERSELFALQRKQAVLRSQIQNFRLQHGLLDDQRGQLTRESEVLRSTCAHWRRKEESFHRYTKLKMNRKHLQDLAQEDAEQEVRTIWKR